VNVHNPLRGKELKCTGFGDGDGAESIKILKFNPLFREVFAANEPMVGGRVGYRKFEVSIPFQAA
jgi:hypothetical protein